MEDLTDEEILSLAGALRGLREELSRALATSAEGTKPVSLEQPIGRVSRMDALQNQELAKAARRQQELRLGQVQQALAAVKRGDYGYCRACDEPIGIARLRARPESPLCLRCQGGRERRR